MNARPFRLLTATAMDEIDRRCRDAVTCWARDWLPRGGALPETSLAVHDASRQAAEPDEPGWLLQDGRAGFLWAPASALNAMARALFETDDVGPHGVLTDVVHAALEALLNALMEWDGAAMPLLCRALPAAHALPGATVVDVTLTIGTGRIVLVHDMGDHEPARPRTREGAPAPPLSILASALGDQAVTVQVELDDIEIDLKSLYALSRGDVIQLGTRLDGSVRLRVEGTAEPVSVQGYLGALGRHRAIELAASSAS